MEHLAWAREENDLSQRELSELTDIKRQRISLFECGNAEPTDEELETIADALGYDPDDLL